MRTPIRPPAAIQAATRRSRFPRTRVAGGAGERGKYDHKEPGPDGDGLREPEVEVHESGA